MSSEEKIMSAALSELAKKFNAVWHQVTYMQHSETFSIDLPGFCMDDVIPLNEFCVKNNLTWVVMQSLSLNKRGVSIKFYKGKS